MRRSGKTRRTADPQAHNRLEGLAGIMTATATRHAETTAADVTITRTVAGLVRVESKFEGCCAAVEVVETTSTSPDFARVVVALVEQHHRCDYGAVR